jgi:hypothetical protein
LLADVASAEIKAPDDVEMRLRFKMLSEQFAKDCLLGEIFGSDDESVAPRWTAGNGRER